MLNCDIFCRVIDNFGDAGIAWRLARSLSRELGLRTRLIIDDVKTLAAIVPELTLGLRTQTARDITVTLWDAAFESTVSDAASVVIEAFSCRLPDLYDEAIARRIDGGQPTHVFALDYLTAEDYAEGSHGLMSPHPRLGFKKMFFFPGFTPRTGGIIYEKGLAEHFSAFRAGPSRAAFLEQLGTTPSHPFTLFFFTYPVCPVSAIAQALLADSRPVQLLLAPGAASDALLTALDAKAHPHIRVVHLPMLAQDVFDNLLASVDAALVRGEDSTMRAQLAGTPLLWTLYPQDEMYHLVKMRAFNKLYAGMLPDGASQTWQSLMTAVNGGDGDMTALWQSWRSAYAAMKAGAESWQARLFADTSLTTRLGAVLRQYPSGF